MRVFSCKSYCPSISSFKSSLSLYSPCPLRLEDVQHVSEEKPKLKPEKPELADEKGVLVKEESDVGKVEILLKSSLKKSPDAGSVEIRKGRVKWVDHVGRELVEIREFEPIFVLAPLHDLCQLPDVPMSLVDKTGNSPQGRQIHHHHRRLPSSRHFGTTLRTEEAQRRAVSRCT